jgi:hypothetical protein
MAAFTLYYYSPDHMLESLLLLYQCHECGEPVLDQAGSSGNNDTARRHGTAQHGKSRQGKARHCTALYGIALQCSHAMALHDMARHGTTRLLAVVVTVQSRAKTSKARQSQGKDRQSRAKTGKDRQSQGKDRQSWAKTGKAKAKTGKAGQSRAKTGKDRQRQAKLGKDRQRQAKPRKDRQRNHGMVRKATAASHGTASHGTARHRYGGFAGSDVCDDCEICAVKRMVTRQKNSGAQHKSSNYSQTTTLNSLEQHVVVDTN